MPLMNGPEFAKAVRSLPDYRFVKIMMITTETDESRKDIAKNSGVSAWMKKPFKPETLLDAVKKLV
jgi:two-component system chemotaxis response regulator CheY